MRTLIAFDKFKDGITAREACDAAATALLGLHPDWTLDRCPLTDGGEGFADTLTTAAGGVFHSSTVRGPLDAPVEARFGMVPLSGIPSAARALLEIPERGNNSDDRVAIVEMASASGLALLPHDLRNPWRTCSHACHPRVTFLR